MAANALNKMRDAVGEKRSADEFEYVEVPRYFSLLFRQEDRHTYTSDKRIGALIPRDIDAKAELRHFIDPGI